MYHLDMPSLPAIASKAGLRGPSPTTTKLAEGTSSARTLATAKKRPGPFSGERRPIKPTAFRRDIEHNKNINRVLPLGVLVTRRGHGNGVSMIST